MDDDLVGLNAELDDGEDLKELPLLPGFGRLDNAVMIPYERLMTG